MFIIIWLKKIIKLEELSNEENEKIPRFGNNEYSSDLVLNFYNYWEKFSTNRKFENNVKYDLNTVNDSCIRKLMQKENKKKYCKKPKRMGKYY